ncbi:MAG: Glu-tRNA(Gln) amidotransferase subunit GatD [Candidatus Altiarchaeota archaeon]
MKQIENIIEPGNIVEVKTKDSIYKGIIMERPKLAEDSFLVIKLENGYDIGLRKEKIEEIKLIGKVVKKEKKKKIEITESDSKNIRVAIISTGGTISSRVDYYTGGVYASFSAEELLESYPELRNFANIKTIDLMRVMSEDMNPKLWIKIAEAVTNELSSDDIKGVVIAHGTDTMHYTSAALSFMLQDIGKPIALTGSQRSPDRGSADAFINLLCSVIWASSKYSNVAVVMHGSMEDTFCFAHLGTKVRKMHTSARDAFQSINTKPLAKIFPNGKIEEISEDIKKRSDTKIKLMKEIEERVALIKIYPGIDPEIVNFYIEKKFKGIVFEGTGLGHLPTIFKEKSFLEYIKKAVDSGMSIAMTSQCIYGRVNPYVYTNLRKLSSIGVIYCEDMLPETAYVKLMWVLGQTKEQGKVKDLMLKNFAGEISERSVINKKVS